MPVERFLLKEDGGFLLTEDGLYLILDEYSYVVTSVDGMGDIHGNFYYPDGDVDIVGPYGDVLFTNDPGTEINGAFGSAVADFILYGVVNGTFSQGPGPGAGTSIGSNNPIPYWTGPHTSGNSIDCTWVADAASPSGYNLRFTIAAGTALDEAYFEQIVPIGGSRTRQTGNRCRADFYTVSGTAGGNFFVRTQYLTAAGATTGIALEGSTSWGSNGAASTATAMGHAIAGASPPADATSLRIRVGLWRSSTDANTRIVDLASVRNERAIPVVLVAESQSADTYTAGQIIQVNGEMFLRPDGGAVTPNTGKFGISKVTGVTILPPTDTAAGLRLGEQTSAATPPADQYAIYLKLDGKLYGKNDAGTERQLDGTADHVAAADPHTGYVLESPAASQTIQPTDAAVVPLILKGATSQSGDLIQLRNSSGDVLAAFADDSNLHIGNGAESASPLSVRSRNRSNIRLDMLQNGSSTLFHSNAIHTDLDGALDLVMNAYLDNYPSAEWNRFDTGRPAAVVDVDSQGDIAYYRVAAGANPANFAEADIKLARSNGYSEIATMTVQPLVFRTSAVVNTPIEAMRITTAQRVGIGTANPDTLLNAETTADESIALFKLGHAAAGGTALQLYATRAGSTDFNFLKAFSNVGGASDLEFKFTGDGTGSCDGSWTGSGADYAECFEALDGKAIAVGTTVVLERDKVRPAEKSDKGIIGVVRPAGASTSIGNAGWNRWSGQYLKDDYGSYVLEDYEVWEWTEEVTELVADSRLGHRGEEVERVREVLHSYAADAMPAGVAAPREKKVTVQQRRKLNPNYDPAREYVPREQRPEWVIVGLLGQVPMTRGQPVGDRWIKMRDVSPSVETWLIR